MIKAVTFDFWDTLVYSVDYTLPRIDFLARKLTDMGFSIKMQDIKKAYEAATDYFYNSWKNKQRYVSPMQRIDRILNYLKIVLPDKSKQSICCIFEEIILEVPPPLVENAEKTIKSIAKYVKVGLICDSGMSPGRVLRKVLENHKMLHYFASTVFSDEVGRNKPHISMFKRALTELNVEPHETIHIGDLVETDMVGAKEAGIRAIWFNTRRVHAQHTIKHTFNHEIHNLLELKKILHYHGYEQC